MTGDAASHDVVVAWKDLDGQAAGYFWLGASNRGTLEHGKAPWNMEGGRG